MHFPDTAEPTNWDLQRIRETLQEWENVASQILEHLGTDQAHERLADWRPHAGQIVKAVHAFRGRCRAEIAELGLWREDGLQPDEAYEIVWGEADRLVHWLGRMIA